MPTSDLATLITAQLSDRISWLRASTDGLHMDAGGQRKPLSPEELSSLVRLVSGAISKGVTTDSPPEVTWTSAAEGNSARAVVFAAMPVRFVVKVDGGAGLLAEARVIEEFRTRADLPDAWRTAFPRVYGTTHGDGFYAYVMEHLTGYQTLASLMADSGVGRDRVRGVVAELVKLLFEGYGAMPDPEAFPLRPDAGVLYAGRIVRRMKELPLVPGRGTLAKLLSREWVVNGHQIESPDALVGWLEGEGGHYARRTGPPFTTVVHGDPHPRNVFCRPGAGSADIRLIDPKGWGHGDYLFDVVKLAQFFDFVGLLRRPGGVSDIAVAERQKSVDVKYTLNAEPRERDVLSDIMGRTTDFAGADGGHPDPEWQIRYKLAMASMVLGVIHTQAEKETHQQCVVRLAHGFVLLSEFKRLVTARFGPTGAPARPTPRRQTGRRP